MKHHFAGRVGHFTLWGPATALWIAAAMLCNALSTCVAEQPVAQPTPLEILAQAEQIAQSLPTFEGNSFVSSLATSRARAGDLDGALAMVDEIRPYPWQQGTLTRVAQIVHRRGDPIKAGKLLADFEDRLLRGDFPNDGDPTLRFLSPQEVEAIHKRMAIESLRDIARAQTEMGGPQSALATCRNALELIEQIDVQQRAVYLRDIAVEQARANDVAAALQTVERISEASGKDEALGLISQAQVDTGDLQGALQTVERITSGRVMPLMTIAHEQARNGQIEQALATVQLAKAKASNPSERQQAELLDDLVAVPIVEAQLTKGDLSGANETVQSINNPRFKSLAIGSIARWQGSKGDLKGAMDTLLAVDPPTDNIFRALAEVKAKSGDSAGALQDAEQISDPSHRMMAYFEIARAQAKAGDTTAVAKSVDAALKASRGLHPAHNPSQNNGHAAIIYAKMGDYNRAVELVLAVAPEFRAHFLTQIAKMRAKTGDVAGAIAMVKQMGSSADQVNGLIGVAEGLMDE